MSRRRSKEETARLRKILYDIQGRCCPVCETEVEYGTIIYEHKPSGLVVCQKCNNLLSYMRVKAGLVLNNAIKLMMTGTL